ncbi:hypothetical protein GCM10028819_39050 [Spirosoma humi]
MNNDKITEYNLLINRLLIIYSHNELHKTMDNDILLINNDLYYILTNCEAHVIDRNKYVLNKIIKYLVEKWLVAAIEHKEKYLKNNIKFLSDIYALIFLKELFEYHLSIDEGMNYKYVKNHYERLISLHFQETIGKVNYTNIPESSLKKRLLSIDLLLSIVDELSTPLDWALLCGEKGDTLFHLREYKNSIDEYRKAIDIFIIENNTSLLATTQRSVGNSYLKIMKLPEDEIEVAINHFKESLKFYTKYDFPNDWASINRKIADSYLMYSYNKENISEAINCLNLALEVYTTENFPENWASIHMQLGNIYFERIHENRAKNIEFAIEKYNISQSFFMRDGHPITWAMLQHNLGNAYNERVYGKRSENIELAIQYQTQALGILTKEHQPILWIDTNVQLSNLYITRPTGNKVNNLKDAKDILDKLINFVSRDNYPVQWARTHATLGVLYNEEPQTLISVNKTKALDEYNLALSVFTLNEYPFEWAQTKNNLGNLYSRHIDGDVAESIEISINYFNEALKVRSKSNFPKEWAETTNNLAMALSRRVRGDRSRNIDTAIKLYQEVLLISNLTNFPLEWANTQCNLSIAYRERISGDKGDNLEDAKDALELSLNVFNKEDSPVEWAISKQNLGLLFIDRIKGDLNKNIINSINLFRESLEIINKIDFPYHWAAIQLNLGLAYYKCANNQIIGYLKLAISAFNLALEVFTPDTYPEECKSASFKCGQSYCLLDEWYDARQVLEISHSATEILRQQFHRADSKSNLSNKSTSLYSLLIYACIKSQDYEAAFNYVQASKGRTDIERLQSLQSIEDVVMKYPELLPRYEEVKILQKQLDALTSNSTNKSRSSTPNFIPISDANEMGKFRSSTNWEINSIRQNIKAKLEAISYLFPVSTAIQYSPSFEVSSAKELAKNLNSIFIEFLNHPKMWMAFIVDENNCYYVPLPNITPTDINSCVKVLESFQQGRYAYDFSGFEKLYKDLWLPLMPYLTNEKSIVVAPHSILYAVPIGALQSNKYSRPICEEFTLSTVSSISFLSAIYQQSNKSLNNNSRLLSIVYAGSSSKTSDYLYNVEAEAIAIAKNFDETIKLTSSDATPENVAFYSNSQLFEVIHFGCHGYFDASDSNYAALKINGSLSVQNIINSIRFNGSPLVTLAACQTGMVEQATGGDLTGLTQALFIAGASNVIATLWPVKDRPTRELLEIFYKKRKEGVSNSVALQFAITAMRNNSRWRDPLYWAAFQIFGLPI